MDEKQSDLKKTSTDSQVNKQLDKTSEEHQELEAVVHKLMAKKLEKIESRIDQLIQKVSSYEEEAQQRHKLILKSQKKPKSIFAKIMSKFNSKK
jgi:Mg2+ and Co2+ transporter CorA